MINALGVVITDTGLTSAAKLTKDLELVIGALSVVFMGTGLEIVTMSKVG
jgi:hypothetical protein